jgi:hypothetical protein
MAQDRLRDLIRRPWRDVTLPPHAVGIPTMLSKTERRLLYSLARDYAGGDAAIVDAGCFLGGSTAALLAGIGDRAEPWTGAPVESYDLFRVEAFTIPKFFGSDRKVRVGDSFRQRFDAHVARYDAPHVVHEGDITKIGWSGGPIDVLFLDVLKSWEINDAVLRDFFPALVPGRSVIVHQDYGWGDTPWIPVTVELLRDSLVLLDWMEWGSHVFFVERPLPVDVLQNGVGRLDIETKIRLIDEAVARVEGWVRGMLEISRGILVAERDGTEVALAELGAVEERQVGRGLVLACLDEVRQALGTSAAAAVR